MLSAGIGSLVFQRHGQRDRSQLELVRVEPVVAAGVHDGDAGPARVGRPAGRFRRWPWSRSRSSRGPPVGPCHRQTAVVLLPVAAMAVGLLAIAYGGPSPHEPADAVLFSGQHAFGSLFSEALRSCRCPPWRCRRSSSRRRPGASRWAGFLGGPTFPALFIGAVGGLLVANLPGLPRGWARAIPDGSDGRVDPYSESSAVVLTLLLTSEVGLADDPPIIVSVVVAYIATGSRCRRPRPTR